MSRAFVRPLRSAVRKTIERLPIGRDTALRVARTIAGGAESAASRRRGVLPKRYQVTPAPPPVTSPWPEPPDVEAPLTIVPHVGPAAGGGEGDATNFDVALFEALNEEYRSRPLVPEPRGNDAASATERARKRLQMVHESIDLGGGKRILEFGCAAGYEVWTMARHFGADAVGVDIEERKAWTTLQGDRVSFVRADIAAEHPFPPDSFDRVVSFSVFEHVWHPHASAAELFRILKPGGLAWISANLYRGPMASHRYREVFFPWPHILFQDDVFLEFYRRAGKRPQGAAWVNRLSWLDYEQMFKRIGFGFKSLRFSERPIDEAFYRRFEGILGRYPRWDLERDFFHVVLEKPR